MNKILSKLYICFVIVLLFIWCAPFAFAAENTGTLRIYLKSMESEKAMQDARVQIYKIADYDVENTVLTQEFSLSGISTNTLNDDPNSCVDLLENFISKSEVRPYQTETTDADGLAEFTSLNNGIYFVQKAQESYTDYSMKPFVVAVPSMDEEGNLTKEITCKPKCGKIDSTDVSVTKIWQDGDGKGRPESIEITLYNGDDFVERIKLSEDNNWTYVWENMDAEGQYSVKENVPDGYESSVSESDENVFIVTNTKRLTVDNYLPKTGEIWWYIPILIAVGLFAVLLIRSSKNKQD